HRLPDRLPQSDPGAAGLGLGVPALQAGRPPDHRGDRRVPRPPRRSAVSGPSREAIRAEALRIGFAACGFARLDPSRRADALDRWLAAGYAGTMRYLHRQKKKRKAPAAITPGARSAVVLLENYTAPPEERHRPGDRYRIASYARGMDYHLVSHGRLHRLSEWMKAQGAELAHT